MVRHNYALSKDLYFVMDKKQKCLHCKGTCDGSLRESYDPNLSRLRRKAILLNTVLLKGDMFTVPHHKWALPGTPNENSRFR